jgi:hypothetical protein
VQRRSGARLDVKVRIVMESREDDAVISEVVRWDRLRPHQLLSLGATNPRLRGALEPANDNLREQLKAANDTHCWKRLKRWKRAARQR